MKRYNATTLQRYNATTLQRYNATTQLSKALIVFSFIMYSTLVIAQQAQQLSWSVLPNQVNFTTTPPAVSTLPSALPATDVLNSMHDKNGNLLFYVTDDVLGSGLHECKLFYKDGTVIDVLKHNGNPNLDLNLYADQYFYYGDEVSIVPFPGSCTKFYIITTYSIKKSEMNILYLPVYAILDMSLPNITNPNSYGALLYDPLSSGTNVYYDLVSQAQAIDPYHFQAEFHTHNISGLAVVPRTSLPNNSYFLYIYNTTRTGIGTVNPGTANVIFRYIIDANIVGNSGIHFDSSPSDFGMISPPYSSIVGNNSQYIEMEAVKLANGYRLACVNDDYFVQIFNLDANGVFAGATASYHNVRIREVADGDRSPLRGLEFSKTGNNLFYTSLDITGNGCIGYLDCSGIAYVNHNLITANYPGAEDLGNSFIEMGYNGVMYFNMGDKLISLINPDLAPIPAYWNTKTIQLTEITTPILPDQIDGEDYYADAFFMDYTAGTNGSGNYTNYADPNQVWTPLSNPFGGTSHHPVYTVDILDKIVIPPGYNITIQGMTFKFKARTIDNSSGTPIYSWGARVLVKNVTSTTGPQTGGKLTLTSFNAIPTIFTNDGVCTDGMWEGIEVWGNPALTQASGKQGSLKMYNSSVISNAYIGALTGKKFYNATTTYVYNTPSYGGGIIQAYSNSEFLNNQYGAYFMPYNIGTNISTFNTAKFTTNAQFVSADNVFPIAQVYLNDVKGIYFKACTFKNDLGASASPYSQTYLGVSQVNMGIRANQSQFYCIPATYGSTAGCTFTNLKYGIIANYYDNTKTVTVDYATFANNYRGVYLVAAKLKPTIIRSNFSILDYYNANVNNASYGLYLNNCTSYKVEGNYFTTNGGSTATTNDFGVIVNNSGTDPNEIYRNTFENLYAGIETRLANCHLTFGLPDGPNDHGLQLKCNQFYTIKRADMGIVSGCTDYHQGYNNHPIGNKLSHSGNNATNDYFNYSTQDGSNINYVCNQDIPHLLQAFSVYPAILLSIIPLDYDATTDCQSTLRVIKKPIELQTEIKAFQAQIDVLKKLIDAGSSPELVAYIQSLTPPITLKNKLMEKSPYLSDEVLIAAIHHTPALPPNMLKDILIANSPITKPVMDELNKISLPVIIRNQINAAQTGISMRKKAEENILYYQFKTAMNFDDIVRSYINDTTITGADDSIMNTLKDQLIIDDRSTAKELLADLYIDKGDYNRADVLLNEMRLDPVKQNVVKLKEVTKSLKQNNQNIYALQTDLINKQKVLDVAAEPENEGYETAINILQQVFDEPYTEQIDDFINNQHRPISYANLETVENIKLPTLYPNPSNGSFQLNYNLSEGEQGELKIMDIAGRLISKYNLNASESELHVNQNTLSNGVYLYQVIINNSVITADKLTIINQ